MTTPHTAADLRTALADRLTEQGVLPDAAWRDAFATVPREVFVPYYFVPWRGRPGWRLVEADREWLTDVYTDEALVTQLGGDEAAVEAARRGETVEGTPTSSSSAPGLMATMLSALDVRAGDRALEIGTGTGYHAALLATRLGADHVTTVEVDPAVTDRARQSLAAAGYRPWVICADGALGAPAHAPYDRVIATVALSRVPPAWLEQTHDGALILIPLSFAGHGGLMALLTRDADGGAGGRFVSQYGGFMSTRSTPTAPPPTIRPSLSDTARPTEVPPEALTDGHPAAFYLSLRCPSPYRVIQFTPDDPAAVTQTWGHGADGSTFALLRTDGTTQVGATGPLWATLEAAYHEWRTLGRPERHRFGLSAEKHRQWVWLDTPDHRITELGTT